jgi:uncharacterized protein
MKSVVILDTNVWISGMISKGHPHDILVHIRHGHIVALGSMALLDEIKDVLLREKISQKLSSLGLSPEIAFGLIQEILLVIPIENDFRASQLRDARDNHLLACADAAHLLRIEVEAVVTGDDDLLVLHEFKDIPILSPQQWINQRRNK